MHETELIGLVLRWPTKIENKRLYMYVLNFAIRPWKGQGCLGVVVVHKKSQAQKFVFHARWKVLISKVTLKIWY